MIYYMVDIVVKGYGGIAIGKPKGLLLPEWHRYLEGGRVYKEEYVKGSPRIPHFLCFYRKRYIVEYHINNGLSPYILSPKDICSDRLRNTVKPIPGSLIKYNGKQYFVIVDDNGEYKLATICTSTALASPN